MGIFPHTHNDRNVLYPYPTTPVVSLATVFVSSSERAWETATPGRAKANFSLAGWVQKVG